MAIAHRCAHCNKVGLENCPEKFYVIYFNQEYCENCYTTFARIGNYIYVYVNNLKSRLLHKWFRIKLWFFKKLEINFS